MENEKNMTPPENGENIKDVLVEGLNEEHVDSKITITGRLSAKENEFVLNENPDSRSVVTFKLKVKRWGLKRKLRKLDGQTVTLTGKLLEAPSPWKKTMSVLSLD